MILSPPRLTAIQGSPRDPYTLKSGAYGIATLGQTLEGWQNHGISVTSQGFALPGNGQYAWRDDGRILRRLQFDIQSSELGDVFFGCNDSGQGTMFRLDTRGGDYPAGFGTTDSWTKWNGPSSGFFPRPNTWYTVTLDLTESTARAVIVGGAGGGVTLSTTYTPYGTAIGLQGDLFGSGTTYIRHLTVYV